MVKEEEKRRMDEKKAKGTEHVGTNEQARIVFRIGINERERKIVCQEQGKKSRHQGHQETSRFSLSWSDRLNTEI